MLKPRLEKFYDKVVCEDFILLYNFKNISQIPSLERAVLNSTSKNFLSSKFALLQSFSAWSLGTSQKCVNTRARKSIALFGIREMNILGLKVTLRKVSFYTMLDKLLIFVLPKVMLNSKVFGTILEDRESTKTLKTVELRKKEGRFVPLQLSKASASLEDHTLSKDLISAKNSVTERALSLFLKKSLKKKRENKQNHFYEKNINVVPQRFSYSFFTISNRNSLYFPEISQLLNFFDLLPGFSIMCSLKVSHKSDYPKQDCLTKPLKNNRIWLSSNSSIACIKRNQRKKILLSAFQLPIFGTSKI